MMLGNSNRSVRRDLLTVFAVVLFLTAEMAFSQSLGDVARENQQKKAADTSSAPAKVITNADLPKNPDGYTGPPTAEEQPPAPDTAASHRATAQRATERRSAEQWKRQILAQRNVIANLQERVDRLRGSIRFVDPNVAYDYYAGTTFNRSQAAQMQRLKELDQQLAEQKRRLLDLQEAARHAGMHTPVYDP